MVVTGLEEVGKNKFKVYIDYEFHFILYSKDIRVNRLEVNQEINSELYEDIRVNTVLRRAKQKAMAILKYMDRTEEELVTKLIAGGYTREISMEALNYVKKFHYVDDRRYASNYICSKKSSKSIRQIQIELSRKGIDKETIQEIIEEEYDVESGEEIAIKKAIAKKTSDINSLSKEERMKLLASLYRKGFSSENVRKYMGDSEFY